MIYRFGDCVLDTTLYELRVADATCAVEPQVFDLLRYMVENRGRVVTREEVLDAIWPDRVVSETTLSSRIKAARKAIGDNGREQRFIKTVHGRGFRFVSEVIEQDTDHESSQPARGPSVTGPELAERDDALTQLDALFDTAKTGQGRVALVSGEAGIGKTALLEAFRFRSETLRFWVGRCDALSTPRPLGPLLDIAREAAGELDSLLTGDVDRHGALEVILHCLTTAEQPTVLVFEDVHWADEASVDFLVAIARRIEPLPALIIATYRSDEIGTDHLLRRFLGSAPPRATTRIELARLSPGAIQRLAACTSAEVARLHALTGGNPFYLSEVLADRGHELPPTVRDAVLARVSRLSGDAREVVELLSISPGRVAMERFLELRPEAAGAVDEALAAGTIRTDGEMLFFRHELGRISVYDSLPPARRRQLHRQVLDGLRAQPEDRREFPEIVHHARALGDGESVAQFAPRAATTASRSGAHREAVNYYKAALEYESRFSQEELASILEGLAFEIYLTGSMDDALAARERALGIREELGDELAAGSNLRWLSRLHWFAGHNAEARHYAAKAVARLERLPPSRELAMAYSNRAQLAMLAGRKDPTLRWGERAIELAKEFGDREVVAHAMINIGLVKVVSNEEDGWLVLDDALQICLDNDFHEHAVRAHAAIATAAVANRDYPRARSALDRGLAYCIDYDLASWSPYFEAWVARFALETGDWKTVEQFAAPVVASDAPAPSRISALAPMGLMLIRRGDTKGREFLDEALQLAKRAAELQRLAPVVSALAETAWLHGTSDEVREELRAAYELAVDCDRAWAQAELAYWVWKHGGSPDVSDLETPTPFALQVEGDWKGAAREWERIGCPWERALALGEGDPAAIREALSIMRDMGSSPGMNAIARDARARGIDIEALSKR